MMKYRNLGSTGVQVSEFCFGGAAISGEGGGYGFGEISEKDSAELVDYAIHCGVNFFDTAPIYGFGLSEQRLGKFLASKRDQIYLVSKSGVTWHDNKRVDMTNDPKIAEKMLHQSLKDLDTDYIDLYMIHWPDAKIDIRYPLEVLKKAQDQQKIRWIGLCNTNNNDLDRAQDICRVEVVQSQLNLFETSVVEELFPRLKEQQIGFMSWGSLDKGILTGRVSRDRKYDESDCRSWAPWWNKKDVQRKVEIVDKWRPQIEERGHSLLEWSLGFNLSFSEVSTAICGARSKDQLEGLLTAIERRPLQSADQFKLEI